MKSLTLEELEEKLELMRRQGAIDNSRIFVKLDNDSPIDITDIYNDNDNDIIICIN